MVIPNKTMKALIRVDASDMIGHGHVMRCLTLARELTDRGWLCTFVCREHKGHLGRKILSEGYQCILLPVKAAVVPATNGYTGWCGETPRNDAQQTYDAVGKQQFDWLIVDHYELDEKWEKSLRKTSRKVLVIDDLANRKHDCDILLDQTPGRCDEDYRNLTPAHSRLLLNSHYALLRQEFARARPQSLKRRWNNPATSLLLSLGGTDPDNLTLKVLQELEQSLLPNHFKLTVLPGTNPAHRESAHQFATSSRLAIQVLESTDNMALLLSQADLAIGAAGGSSWERASLGLPCILLKTAQNQATVFQMLKDCHCVTGITNVAEIPEALSDTQTRHLALSIRSAALVDGKGASRVADVLEDTLPECGLTWRPVTSADKPRLIKWFEADSAVSEPNRVLSSLLSQRSICLVIESGDDIFGLVTMDYDNDGIQVYCLFDQSRSPLDAELFALLQLDALFSDSMRYTVSGELSNYPGISQRVSAPDARVVEQQPQPA